MCEICSKKQIYTKEQLSVVDFQQINVGWVFVSIEKLFQILH